MWDFMTHALHVLAQVAPDVSDSVTSGLDAAATAAGAGASEPGLMAPSLDDGLAIAEGVSTGVDAQQPGILNFIAQSDWVGKSLFVILVFMSLLSWYLIFSKLFINMSIRGRSKRFLKEFWAAGSLDQVESQLVRHKATEPFANLAGQALRARNHHARFGATNLEEKGSTSAFVTRIMRKVIDEETARLENGLTVLASIGSTAPFVGLFGTVWGVYHALISIGMTDGVTVNSIAGPVGEALIMTGLGLAVAIPAVLAYNGFVRGNRVYLARLDAFAHDLFTVLSTGQQVPQIDVIPQPVALAASGGN